MKYRTIWDTSVPADAEPCNYGPSRTPQDIICTIPELLEHFHGDLKEIHRKYDNGLAYESIITNGVWIDQLDSEQVKKLDEFKSNQERLKAEQAENDRLFAEFKRQTALKVKEQSSVAPADDSQE